MKKLNRIWVFSDSIKGHEIQSLALAQSLAINVDLFHCAIRQPWLCFAPRILPRFGRNIIWKNKKPDLTNKADVVITCGRRMAVIGKYYKRLNNIKHIQILNPGDHLNKYDVVICPEHDQLSSQNLISTKGSLHTISLASLSNIKNTFEDITQANGYISLMLGNPNKKFFKNLPQTAEIIKKYFPKHDLIICGSRRTSIKHHNTIKSAFHFAKKIWFDEKDGKNPYKVLLAHSQVIFVTADSINMLSEACATDKNVIALASRCVKSKHQRFLQSIHDRLSGLEDEIKPQQPLHELEKTVNKVLKKLI